MKLRSMLLEITQLFVIVKKKLYATCCKMPFFSTRRIYPNRAEKNFILQLVAKNNYSFIAVTLLKRNVTLNGALNTNFIDLFGQRIYLLVLS